MNNKDLSEVADPTQQEKPVFDMKIFEELDNQSQKTPPTAKKAASNNSPVGPDATFMPRLSENTEGDCFRMDILNQYFDEDPELLIEPEPQSPSTPRSPVIEPTKSLSLNTILAEEVLTDPRMPADIPNAKGSDEPNQAEMLEISRFDLPPLIPTFESAMSEPQPSEPVITELPVEPEQLVPAPAEAVAVSLNPSVLGTIDPQSAELGQLLSTALWEVRGALLSLAPQDLPANLPHNLLKVSPTNGLTPFSKHVFGLLAGEVPAEPFSDVFVLLSVDPLVVTTDMQYFVTEGAITDVLRDSASELLGKCVSVKGINIGLSPEGLLGIEFEAIDLVECDLFLPNTAEVMPESLGKLLRQLITEEKGEDFSLILARYQTSIQPPEVRIMTIEPSLVDITPLRAIPLNWVATCSQIHKPYSTFGLTRMPKHKLDKSMTKLDLHDPKDTGDQPSELIDPPRYPVPEDDIGMDILEVCSGKPKITEILVEVQPLQEEPAIQLTVLAPPVEAVEECREAQPFCVESEEGSSFVSSGVEEENQESNIMEVLLPPPQILEEDPEQYRFPAQDTQNDNPPDTEQMAQTEHIQVNSVVQNCIPIAPEIEAEETTECLQMPMIEAAYEARSESPESLSIVTPAKGPTVSQTMREKLGIGFNRDLNSATKEADFNQSQYNQPLLQQDKKDDPPSDIEISKLVHTNHKLIRSASRSDPVVKISLSDSTANSIPKAVSPSRNSSGASELDRMKPSHPSENTTDTTTEKKEIGSPRHDLISSASRNRRRRGFVDVFGKFPKDEALLSDHHSKQNLDSPETEVVVNHDEMQKVMQTSIKDSTPQKSRAPKALHIIPPAKMSRPMINIQSETARSRRDEISSKHHKDLRSPASPATRLPKCPEVTARSNLPQPERHLLTKSPISRPSAAVARTKRPTECKKVINQSKLGKRHPDSESTERIPDKTSWAHQVLDLSSRKKKIFEESVLQQGPSASPQREVFAMRPLPPPPKPIKSSSGAVAIQKENRDPNAKDERVQDSKPAITGLKPLTELIRSKRNRDHSNRSRTLGRKEETREEKDTREFDRARDLRRELHRRPEPQRLAQDLITRIVEREKSPEVHPKEIQPAQPARKQAFENVVRKTRVIPVSPGTELGSPIVKDEPKRVVSDKYEKPRSGSVHARKLDAELEALKERTAAHFNKAIREQTYVKSSHKPLVEPYKFNEREAKKVQQPEVVKQGVGVQRAAVREVRDQEQPIIAKKSATVVARVPTVDHQTKLPPKSRIWEETEDLGLKETEQFLKKRNLKVLDQDRRRAEVRRQEELPAKRRGLSRARESSSSGGDSKKKYWLENRKESEQKAKELIRMLSPGRQGSGTEKEDPGRQYKNSYMGLMATKAKFQSPLQIGPRRPSRSAREPRRDARIN